MNPLKKRISENLIYIPLLWIATGMFAFSKGDKILLIILGLCICISLITDGFSTIKHNWSNNPWLKWLLVLAIFGVISDKIHGFGSREIRALLTALLLFTFLNLKNLRFTNVIILLLIASSSAAFISYFYQNIHVIDRRDWPVNAIPFASYITLLISISLLLSSYVSNNIAKAILILSSFLGFVALLITESRGPLIALVCTLFLCAIYLLWHKKINWKFILYCSIIVGIAIISTLPYLQSRYDETVTEMNQIQKGNYNTSTGLRLSVYAIGLNMMKEKPIFGHGKDNLHARWDLMLKNKEINWQIHKVLSWNFHNNFIEKGVTSGLIGIATMFLWLGMPIIYGWRLYKEYFLLFSAPPMLYFFASLMDTPATNGSSYVTYLIFVGLILTTVKNHTDRKNKMVEESHLA